MALSKRYVLSPSDDKSDGWLELQDWRVQPEDREPLIELVLRTQEGGMVLHDEQPGLSIWHRSREARQLVAVLNVMLGRADAEDLRLVNGADGVATA
ncbi:MAG: hypothetical protein V7607_2634 [Solirubrobacteraceae bacterium]